jgi:hypothetical protein
MGDVQAPLEAIRIILHLNTARYHSFHQRLVTVNLRAERLCAPLDSKYRDGAARARLRLPNVGSLRRRPQVPSASAPEIGTKVWWRRLRAGI